MKRMWIELKNDSDKQTVKEQLKEIGKVDDDPGDSKRIILTFRNQSENGIRMAGFRLSEDFIGYFKDFDMLPEK